MADNVPRFDGRTPQQLATDAEASVRGIIHLAEANETLLDVETVHLTLSGLARLVEQLPDAVARLRAAADAHQRARSVSIAAGPFADDPDAAIAALHDAVDMVLDGLGPVRMGLFNAQAALAEARPSPE